MEHDDEAAAPATGPGPVRIRLRAEDVKAAALSRNGLTYKGFGMLSGNATSSLLLDYKSEHPEVYWRLMRTLFGGDRPILTTIKIEMGNDRNNSTGPDAASMRERDEYPAVGREPGFQLAADARRYQPGVHVSILRWCSPAWVRTDDDVYLWYKNTILAVYRRFGFMVDSVNPGVNERKPDLGWVCEFARRVRSDTVGFVAASGPDSPGGFRSEREMSLFHAIRVITSDEETTGTFARELIDAPRLLHAVDVASYHYSVEDDDEGNFTALADRFDKEIWNSEAQAVFSNSADRANNTMGDGRDGSAGTGIGGIGGPLEMANTLIKGFVRSRRTHTIYQPAVGSCYENMEYAAKELISARDPWSGWIYYDAGCAVLEHFCHFARLGWESTNRDDDADMNGIWRAIPQASGCEVTGNNPVSGARHGEPSFMTLAQPQGEDVTVVIVNDSPYVRRYRIGLDAALRAAGKPMAVWCTAASHRGDRYDSGWMRPAALIEGRREGDGEEPGSGKDGVEYSCDIQPWSMATLTTVHCLERGCGDVLVPLPGFASVLPATREASRSVLGECALAEGATLAGTTATSGTTAMPGTQAAEISTLVQAGARSFAGAGAVGGGAPAAGSGPDRSRSRCAILYADDFRYAHERPVEVYENDRLTTVGYVESRGGDAGAIPRFTTDTNGAFEIVPDHGRGRVLRQQIDWAHAGDAWIAGDPRTAIGDMRWANYRASVEVSFDDWTGPTPYALLGAREMGGSARTDDICWVDFLLHADGAWLLRHYGEEVARGNAQDLDVGAEANGCRPFAPGAGPWNALALEVNGPVAVAYVNGARIAGWHDDAPQTAGRINLGTSLHTVRFGDLQVRSIAGAFPYYRDIIDDMHMRSWDDGTEILRYRGPWAHDNGQGMFTYMRTLSRVSCTGASVSHTFTGTGLDLFGPSGGRAAVDVVVDGHLLRRAAPVMPTRGSLRCQFRVHGLPRARHTVTFRTANDREFRLDALGVIP
ncbi:MAG: hypothetical protein SOI66_09880 [Bifidobacterium sp.]|jgi:hypothetical protein